MKKLVFISIASLAIFNSDSYAQSTVQNNQINQAQVSSIDFELKPLVSPGSTVLLIGDSLAVGMTHQFKKLAIESGYTPISHAINGTTTSQWLSLVKKDIEEKKPALVIISLGTNDAAARLEWLRTHRGVFAALAKLINESGAWYVWVGPPNIDEKKLPNINEVRSIIQESICLYYDSAKLEIEKSQDGIHSTPSGYKRWMTSVWSWMKMRNIVAR